jgi:hypothetical protein
VKIKTHLATRSRLIGMVSAVGLLSSAGDTEAQSDLGLCRLPPSAQGAAAASLPPRLGEVFAREYGAYALPGQRVNLTDVIDPTENIPYLRLDQGWRAGSRWVLAFTSGGVGRFEFHLVAYDTASDGGFRRIAPATLGFDCSRLVAMLQGPATARPALFEDLPELP